MEERIFHYTKGIHMKNILTQKVIKLSKGFTEFGERSCVSLTTNPVFAKSILPAKPVDPNMSLDKIAKNGIIMSYDIPEYQQITDMKEATKVSKGYYRFEVSSDIDLMSWYEYRSYCKSHGRINEKYFNALENFLYDNESYYDVLFSLKTIYKDKWLNIEVRDVETSNWKRLTTNDVLNIMTMKEVKLTGLKIINPSMEILDIYNN